VETTSSSIASPSKLSEQQQQSLPKPSLSEDEVKGESDLTEEEKEANREKTKWDGYVPADKKRPLDEFYDMSELK
jgi:hypothetical protein